jgi:hypothetical protein
MTDDSNMADGKMDSTNAGTWFSSSIPSRGGTPHQGGQRSGEEHAACTHIYSCYTQWSSTLYTYFVNGKLFRPSPCYTISCRDKDMRMCRSGNRIEAYTCRVGADTARERPARCQKQIFRARIRVAAPGQVCLPVHHDDKFLPCCALEQFSLYLACTYFLR